MTNNQSGRDNNVEKIVIDYLADALEVDVFADVPASRPEEFVTVERLGGAFDTLIIDRPILSVQCWSRSRCCAQTLATTVDKILRKLPEKNNNVTKISRDTLYNFPDLKSNTPRYQIIFNLVIVN